MSSTHTLHDFMLSHGSKLVMATTTTNTTDTEQRTVPRAHKISMSSNRFGLVEIVEVIRTFNQVEMVNHLENDAFSTNVDTRLNRFDDIEILCALGTVRCSVSVVLVAAVAAVVAAVAIVVVP